MQISMNSGEKQKENLKSSQIGYTKYRASRVQQIPLDRLWDRCVEVDSINRAKQAYKKQKEMEIDNQMGNLDDNVILHNSLIK